MSAATPRTRRLLFVLILLSLLLPGLSIRSFGADGPSLSPGVRDVATQSTLSITNYLTEALRLSQAQAAAVRRSTQAELEQLALDATPAAKVRAEQQYEAALVQILSREQYAHFLRIEHGAPIAAAIARLLAVR